MKLWHVRFVHLNTFYNLQVVALDDDAIYTHLSAQYPGYELRSISVHGEDVTVLADLELLRTIVADSDAEGVSQHG